MFNEDDYEKDFEKEGTVSIWLARFSSPDELNAYMEEHEDENENTFSAFYLEFRMGYIDHDFTDAFMHQRQPENLDDLFWGASYGKSIVENMRKSGRLPDVSKYNCYICMYDFAFVPDKDYVRKNAHVDYWGSIAYDPNSSAIE